MIAHGTNQGRCDGKGAASAWGRRGVPLVGES